MKISEQALVFSCAGEQLLGIVARPEQPKTTGVLIVVGGPQYRAGSHRQFLLLSRALAAAGYPAMRFDYRGMGDSTGDLRNFESVSEDIGTAVDAFMVAYPGLERIVLWGLCDAASASLLYWDATRDQRIGGLTLLNPWVRSEATLARAHIKHYYAQRLLQPEFWRKLLSGQLGIWRAMGGFIESLRQSRPQHTNPGAKRALSFQECMAQGIGKFSKPVLLILSADDYTAKEFIEVANDNPMWKAALSRAILTRHDVADADHTFSTRAWRAEVEAGTVRWMGEVSKQ